MTSTVSGIVAALDLANAFRLATGLEVLEGLPKGDMSESRSCILANAFNHNCMVGYGYAVNPEEAPDEEAERVRFWDEIVDALEANGCEVDDYRKQGGCVGFEKQEIAAGFATEAGSVVIDLAESPERPAYSENIVGYDDIRYMVPIHDDVALVAREFDNGALKDYVLDYDE